MIVITYQICSAESQVLTEKQIKCAESMRQANEEIAKREAYNGEYTVEDDGMPESEEPISQAQRIEELEEALDMLLSGVTE